MITRPALTCSGQHIPDAIAVTRAVVLVVQPSLWLYTRDVDGILPAQWEQDWRIMSMLHAQQQAA